MGHLIPTFGGAFDVAGTINADTHPGSYSGQDAYTGRLVAHSLRADGFDASEDGTGRGTPLVAWALAFTCKDHGADAGEISPTLRAMGHDGSHANAGGQVAVCVQESQSGMRMTDAHATLDSNNGSRRHNGVLQRRGVRRLMPVECERLQGLPDNFTLIPYRGKPAKDGPRYKCIGNSIAINVLSWIGQRIQMVESLVHFDGVL
jgi:DNA (cytosine-5)-methyltransferase 1